VAGQSMGHVYWKNASGPRRRGGHAEDAHDGADQPGQICLMLWAEEVDPLQAVECPVSPEIDVRKFAVVEPDRKQPDVARLHQTNLVNCQVQLSIHVGFGLLYASRREARDERQRAVLNRLTDLLPLVFARPEVLRVLPDRNGRRPKDRHQLIDSIAVFADIRNEGVLGPDIGNAHDRSASGDP
jgi:hypothetical protein